jgi:UDP-glucose 4-epimerase
MLADVAKDASRRIDCLRYFNLVGTHDTGQIVEDPNDIPTT